MTLIVKRDDGTSYEWKDVLNYSFIDKDYVQQLANDFFGAVLTDKQLEAVGRSCDKLERFPDSEDLHWIIKSILDE